MATIVEDPGTSLPSSYLIILELASGIAIWTNSFTGKGILLCESNKYYAK